MDDLILDVSDIFSKNIGTPKTDSILWNYFYSKGDILYTYKFISMFSDKICQLHIHIFSVLFDDFFMFIIRGKARGKENTYRWVSV